MRTPLTYFRNGYNAAHKGEPVNACPLLFDAWPRQAWVDGWHYYFKAANAVAKADVETELRRVSKTPFEQGEVAFIRSRPIEACPYGPDSPDWRAWRLGYETRRISLLNKPEQDASLWRKLYNWWHGN